MSKKRATVLIGGYEIKVIYAGGRKRQIHLDAINPACLTCANCELLVGSETLRQQTLWCYTCDHNSWSKDNADIHLQVPGGSRDGETDTDKQTPGTNQVSGMREDSEAGHQLARRHDRTLQASEATDQKAGSSQKDHGTPSQSTRQGRQRGLDTPGSGELQQVCGSNNEESMRYDVDPTQLRIKVLIDGKWTDIGTVNKADLIILNRQTLDGQGGKLRVDIETIDPKIITKVEVGRKVSLKSKPIMPKVVRRTHGKTTY